MPERLVKLDTAQNEKNPLRQCPNELPCVGVLDGEVCVVSHPLKEDEENQVAKDEDEKDQLRDELQEDLGVFLVVHLVP